MESLSLACRMGLHALGGACRRCGFIRDHVLDEYWQTLQASWAVANLWTPERIWELGETKLAAKYRLTRDQLDAVRRKLKAAHSLSPAALRSECDRVYRLGMEHHRAKLGSRHEWRRYIIDTVRATWLLEKNEEQAVISAVMEIVPYGESDRVGPHDHESDRDVLMRELRIFRS